MFKVKLDIDADVVDQLRNAIEKQSEYAAWALEDKVRREMGLPLVIDATAEIVDDDESESSE